MTSLAPAWPGTTRRWSVEWLINRREDLIFFLGSVAASYGLLALFKIWGVPLAVLGFMWAIVFDGPHVWATFSRTYLDTEERTQRAHLLYGSLLWFALGPALVWATQWSHIQIFARTFFFFANLWAYYHLVKQHYGFMVLYKKKNRDLAPLDNALDRLFLVATLGYPFLSMILRYPPAHDYLPLTGGRGWEGPLDRVLGWILVGAMVAWTARQAQRLWNRETINVPKYLLFAACIPMHWIVIATVIQSNVTPVALVPLLTIYHNIQYHRLVWFHNVNKYHKPDAAPRYGFAVRANRTFLRYAIFALLFNFIYQIPRGFLGTTNNYMTWQALAAAFFWGYAFTHYYLDAKIWRVRRDPALNQALHMAEASMG